MEEFVVYIGMESHSDLEFGKIYRKIPDKKANVSGYIRIIDESAEDYLYPERYFEPVQVTPKTVEAYLQLTH